MEIVANDSLHLAYQAATDQVRRLLNQALYAKVFVSPDGVTGVEYTEGFAWLMGVDGQAPEVVDQDVDATNVVDLTVDHGLSEAFSDAKTYNRNSFGHGWYVKRLVEVMLSFRTRSSFGRGSRPSPSLTASISPVDVREA